MELSRFDVDRSTFRNGEQRSRAEQTDIERKTETETQRGDAIGASSTDNNPNDDVS